MIRVVVVPCPCVLRLRCSEKHPGEQNRTKNARPQPATAGRAKLQHKWRVTALETIAAFASVMASPLRTAAPYGPSAHRLGDSAGRSPGSRVSACHPAFPVSQWLTRTTGSPLTVAGAATAATNGPYPCSLLPPRLAPGNQHGAKHSSCPFWRQGAGITKCNVRCAHATVSRPEENSGRRCRFRQDPREIRLLDALDR